MATFHNSSDSHLHFPADNIDYQAISVGEQAEYTMRHMSPGYPNFSVLIKRPRAEEYIVEVTKYVPLYMKRGGRPPNAGTEQTSTATLCSSHEVHSYLRAVVPYTSFQLERITKLLRALAVELPTSLFRFSMSRCAWLAVAGDVQPRLYRAESGLGQSEWRLKLKGAQEPNDVAMKMSSLSCEQDSLRAIFAAADSIWALKFGSRDGFDKFKASAKHAF